ncbi:MAG: hypothetical protein OEX02_17300 [Cyclobacteriaceae bacterium]|nr:hypothetical protein [Cyclobacteriaceae bacterium]
MKKHLLFILALFGIIDMLLLSCGIDKCADNPLPFAYFQEVSVWQKSLATGGVLPDSSTIIQDDYRFVVQADFEYTTFFQPPIKQSGYFAFAKCKEDGNEGLKSNIVQFKITCNKDIPGVNAGYALDQKLNVYLPSFEDDLQNERHSIAEWVSLLNAGMYVHDRTWYFEFTEPIISAEYVQFTLHLELEDGSLIEKNTDYVRFN